MGNKLLNIKRRSFNELSLNELYDMLRLRTEVFVVEQNCVYQDMDGKDENALHILGSKNGKLVAYSRIFPPGEYFEEPAIGRILVRKSERKNSYGHEILEASMKAIAEYYDAPVIKLSAQTYLTKFYEAHGFEQIGKGYMEDGIPHIAMLKKAMSKQ